MEDKEIVLLYFAREERAIAETKTKYGAYCRGIAYRILQNDSDAEECEADTYRKTWESIPPKNPERLAPYLGAICRRTALDRYDEQKTQKRGSGQTAVLLSELSDCLPDGGSDFTDRVALKEALNSFLASCPERTRQIFLQRYFYACSVTEIARMYHMKENNVNQLLFRTRNKLKKHLEKEGIFV